MILRERSPYEYSDIAYCYKGRVKAGLGKAIELIFGHGSSDDGGPADHGAGTSRNRFWEWV